MVDLWHMQGHVRCLVYCLRKKRTEWLVWEPKSYVVLWVSVSVDSFSSRITLASLVLTHVSVPRNLPDAVRILVQNNGDVVECDSNQYI